MIWTSLSSLEILSPVSTLFAIDYKVNLMEIRNTKEIHVRSIITLMTGTEEDIT